MLCIIKISLDGILYITCTLVVFFLTLYHLCGGHFAVAQYRPPNTIPGTALSDLQQHKGGFTGSHLPQGISKFHLSKKHKQTE